MTRKGFLALALLPFLPKKKAKPCVAEMAGATLVAMQTAAKAAIEKKAIDQTIFVGGEIKWRGDTLAMALDKAYRNKG